MNFSKDLCPNHQSWSPCISSLVESSCKLRLVELEALKTWMPSIRRWVPRRFNTWPSKCLGACRANRPEDTARHRSTVQNLHLRSRLYKSLPSTILHHLYPVLPPEPSSSEPGVEYGWIKCFSISRAADTFYYSITAFLLAAPGFGFFWQSSADPAICWAWFHPNSRILFQSPPFLHQLGAQKGSCHGSAGLDQLELWVTWKKENKMNGSM